MTVENTTENRGYQLPHQDNLLEVDVLRLIAALAAIDVDIATILGALAGKADTGHGHVLADVTGLAAALAAKQDVNEKGQANGYAALGADGKVPSAQLPAAIFGAMSYQGTWNANTNTPMIPAASAANKGHYYKVAVAGSTNVDGESDWKVGDWIVSNGAGWDKIDNTDQVVSVAGLTGAISVAALRAALGVLLLSGGTMTGGISFGSEYAASVPSLARHIALYSTTHGFNVTEHYLNYHSVNRHRWLIGDVPQVVLGDGLLAMSPGVGFRLSGDPSHALDAATKQYVDALPITKEYVSAEQSITAAGSFTLSHGLGTKPKIIEFSLVCKTAEGGYAIGDEVRWSGTEYVGGTTTEGPVLVVTSSQIVGKWGNTAPIIVNKTTGANFIVTPANWRLIVRAYA